MKASICLSRFSSRPSVVTVRHAYHHRHDPTALRPRLVRTDSPNLEGVRFVRSWLGKLCKRYKIPVAERGYWRRKETAIMSDERRCRDQSTPSKRSGLSDPIRHPKKHRPLTFIH